MSGLRFGHCEAHHPILAALDLGTNSCRLLVACVNVASLRPSRFNADPPLVGWRVVDSFARIVRLGEGLSRSTTLSEPAVDRALEALALCQDKINNYTISEFRAVATEACRRASNSHELLKKAKIRTSIDLEIISSKEEGRLAVTGCTGVLNDRLPYGLIFDIGGGSTEIMWIRLLRHKKRRIGHPIPFSILDTMSIPYGVVVGSDGFSEDISPISFHGNMRFQVYSQVHAFVEKNNIRRHFRETQFIGSSGTVTTLAAIQSGLQRYERRYIDGILLKTEGFHEVSQAVLHMQPSERLAHPCIGKGRSDLILVGSAILEGILDAIPIPRLRIADRGVREGILFDLLQKFCKTNEHLS